MDRLQSAQDYIAKALRGEIPEDDVDAFEEDQLIFAIREVEAVDMDWLLRNIADVTYPRRWRRIVAGMIGHDDAQNIARSLLRPEGAPQKP